MEPWKYEDIRAIEEAGGVSLNELQREVLEAEIATYVTQVRHRELSVRDEADRKWLEAVIKSLDKMIQVFEVHSLLKFKVLLDARLLSGDTKTRSSYNEIARLKAIRERDPLHKPGKNFTRFGSSRHFQHHRRASNVTKFWPRLESPLAALRSDIKSELGALLP